MAAAMSPPADIWETKGKSDGTLVWPLSPQATTVPSFLRAKLEYNAELIATTLLKPNGVSIGPKSPQLAKEPSALSARTWEAPALTLTALVTTREMSCRAGCVAVPIPQMEMVPSARNAPLNSPPAQTPTALVRSVGTLNGPKGPKPQ